MAIREIGFLVRAVINSRPVFPDSIAFLLACSMMFNRVLVSGIVALLLLGGGCDDGRLPTYPVIGQFKFDDGTVPKFGDVEFYNQAHDINARGKIGRDGTFTVTTFVDGDGAVEGAHQIVLMQNVASPLTAKLDAKINHDHGMLLSTEYFDYRTSDLKCVILKTENRLNLVIRKNKSQTEDGLPKK